jgi:hypothetical protein
VNYSDSVIKELWESLKRQADWESAVNKKDVCTEWGGHYDK